MLRILRISPSEQKVVLNLMAVQFFQGAGIAFFFTAAFAIFLEKLPISNLPLVFIVAAFLLFFTGLGFSWFEHRGRISKISLVLSLIMATSVVIFRIFTGDMHPAWFSVLMLSWYYVIYLLNNLGFWGIASVMFDIRQSKRLFGLVSSGDIPAKFVGYTLASVLVYYTGTANLFLISGLSIALSAPFLYFISKMPVPDPPEHVHVQHRRLPPGGRLRTMVRRFTSNKLIEKAAILALLFSVSLLLINFIFYAEVKTAYYEDKALARFIAAFLAGSRIFAMLLKLVLTGRLLTRLGPKRSLMITPVVLAVFAVLVLAAHYQGLGELTIFYIFGMLAIAAENLNSSIHLPGFLALMQPLPKHERLRAHNIVKGVMDPFAFLATGIVLLLFIEYHGKTDIISLTFLLIVLIFFWVIGIYRVNRQYMKTLIQSITSRTFNNERLAITDKDTIDMIADKLRIGTSLEKIYILRLLQDERQLPGRSELLASALTDPAPEVRKEAIHAIEVAHDDELLPAVSGLLDSEKEPGVISVILKVMHHIKPGSVNMQHYIHHAAPEVRNQVITLILTNEERDLYEPARALLAEMASSAKVSEKLQALNILEKVGRRAPLAMIRELASDPDHDIRKEATLTAGRIGGRDCTHLLLDKLTAGDDFALEALSMVGTDSVPHILEGIRRKDTQPQHQRDLIIACGRSGDESTGKHLVAMLRTMPENTDVIVEALRRCRFRAQEADAELIESVIADQMKHASRMKAISLTLNEDLENFKLLHQAIALELTNKRELILDLFSFLYDKGRMEKIKRGLASGRKLNTDISLELIELSLPPRHVHPFIEIFEGAEMGVRRNREKRHLHNGEWDRISREILIEKKTAFNDWTKACCLYMMKHTRPTNHFDLTQPYLESPSYLLKETATHLTQ